MPMRRILTISALLLRATPAQGPALPAGLVIESVSAGQLSMPSAMDFLPDGRLLVTELLLGQIRVLAAGNMGIAGTIPEVATGGERGLLGIAVDPLWPSAPYVYVHYSHAPSASIRVSRLTASGSLSDPASTNLAFQDPYHILTGAPDASSLHNGGTVAFGPDGMLYVSLGDDDSPCSAVDPASLAGSILRLDISGLRGIPGPGAAPQFLVAAHGNPWPGTTAALAWATGLRNPFRFDIDPVTGILFIADVGSNLFEEINACDAPALHFGWPFAEGPANLSAPCAPPPEPPVEPIATYPNTSGAAVISFGGRYRNVPGGALNLGAAYEGDVFFCDYLQGFVRRVRFDGAAWTPAPPAPGQPDAVNWALGFNWVVDAEIGPDGALYCVRQFPGSIQRIRPDLAGPAILSPVTPLNPAGNAGWTLLPPVTVRLTTSTGSPIGGVPVTFATSPEAGTLGPQPVVTDSGGFATTTFQLSQTVGLDAQIVAAASGAAPLTFTVTSRGLIADYDAPASTIFVAVVHSETDSPFTLAVDAPVAIPFAPSAYGDIWTSLLSPLPTLAALDGLGLLGAPDPSFRTNPTLPWWYATMPGLPSLGGLSLLLQAYAVDWTRSPSPDAWLISNPVTVTFN